jgi:hypothetical protein
MAENKFDDEVLIVGYKPLAQFLTDHGFPISTSLLSKVCSPAISEGPEIEGYWNKRPAFRPSRALAWARGRMKPYRATPESAPSVPTAAAPPTQPPIRAEPRRGGRPPKQHSCAAALAIAAPPVQPPPEALSPTTRD